MQIAILDDYQQIALSLADWSGRLPGCRTVSFSRHISSPEQAAALLADFDVLCLMRERMTLTRAHFAALPKLKLVVVTGQRESCIDHAAARDHGVRIMLTGGSGGNGAAEHTMALMLSAARRIPQEDRHLRAGGWQQGLGMQLEGRVLGVLGLGKIGRRVASLAAAFGMHPLAWSPNLTPERAAEAGVEFAPRDRFFAEADVVSLHMVLSERSRHLIGAAELAMMKPDALLVNTSRGGLIDEAALITALRAGTIGGAALDVYETEPIPADHPLLALPNTVLTPHIGYVTDVAYKWHYPRTVEVISDWLAEKQP